MSMDFPMPAVVHVDEEYGRIVLCIKARAWLTTWSSTRL